MRLIALCSLLIAFIYGHAQELRVSQYQAVPMVVNPALTGDFRKESKLRVWGLHASMQSNTNSNIYNNISADFKIGKKQNWAMGVNYLFSNQPNFPVAAQVTSLSLAKRFFLDKNKLHQFRVGIQMLHFNGEYDGSKGPYDKWLDANIFLRYNTPSIINLNTFRGRATYITPSYGFKYQFSVERFSFETAISASNINNPYDGYILLGYPSRKRYRVNALTSFQYAYNELNTFRVEHFSWKEGIYLRAYNPAIDDYPEVHETTYSLQWIRTRKKQPWIFGLYSRSWKALSAHFSYGITRSVNVRVSYEEPIYRKFFSVSQLNIGLNYIPMGQKARKSLETPDLNKNILATMPFGTPLQNCQDDILLAKQKAAEMKDSMVNLLQAMSAELWQMRAKQDSCCKVREKEEGTTTNPIFIPQTQRADTCITGDIGAVVLTKNRTLTEEAKADLQRIAIQLRNKPNCSIMVSNTAAGAKQSMQSSWERVSVVTRYLIEQLGISENRIVFKFGLPGKDSDLVLIAGTNEKGPHQVPAPAPYLNNRPKSK